MIIYIHVLRTYGGPETPEIQQTTPAQARGAARARHSAITRSLLAIARSLCDPIHGASSENAQMPLVCHNSPRSTPGIRADSPRSPAHAFPHPCLGSFQPEFGPRARSRAQWVASARGAHYMPSYPRHRASNFRCHTSTNPTRVHGGCDALPFVSRLSHSNHVRLFPLSQKRQRQVTACRSLSRR